MRAGDTFLEFAVRVCDQENLMAMFTQVRGGLKMPFFAASPEFGCIEKTNIGHVFRRLLVFR